MSGSATSITVVFLVYEGVQLLDLAGPAEVFALARELHPDLAYELHFIAPAGGPVKSSTVPVIGVPAAETPAAVHTLVVPGAPGPAISRALEDSELTDWLMMTAQRATRIVSVCTGAFLLGGLGLLDGRRAATHWSAVDRLARAVPTASVDAEALFVEDGGVWTSAGVSTGIDLALEIVSRDMGRDVALNVARELVVDLVRTGGQSQFSGPLSLQSRAGPDLAGLISWANARLPERITIEAMADAVGMTQRTFQRRCTSQFGLSPVKLLGELRLERARMLLADPALQIAAVAEQAGFADAMTLAKAFRRRFGSSPSTYRKSVGAIRRPEAVSRQAAPRST